MHVFSEMSLTQDSVGSGRTQVQPGELRLLLLARWGSLTLSCLTCPKVIPSTAPFSGCYLMLSLPLPSIAPLPSLPDLSTAPSGVVLCLQSSSLLSTSSQNILSILLPLLEPGSALQTLLPNCPSTLGENHCCLDNHSLGPSAPPLPVPAKCPPRPHSLSILPSLGLVSIPLSILTSSPLKTFPQHPPCSFTSFTM